ncbi:MAG TPA: hypothetical protein VKA40_08755 [Nitrososphaera sp.]|nr:hypothetical protein [Nitrososphaera sp.]
MKKLNASNNNRKTLLHNIYLARAATIFALAVVFASTTTTTISPVSATTTGNTTAAASSPALELSAQPVWDEQATSTSVTPINETHRIATFIGNGTMTVPDTGETINMTNNGTAFISFVPGYNETVGTYGREYVFSVDDGDTTAITFNEIIRYDPATFEGSGLVIAVFDNNATGSLAPFNGMMVVGTHEEDPSTLAATIRLWEWESGIPIPPLVTTGMEESPASPTMNTTTTTDAFDANATGTSAGEQQQQQTTPTLPPPTPLLE